MSDINHGTIEEDLILMEGRLRAIRLQLAKDEELIVGARLHIAELRTENAQFCRHLNPAQGPEPITEDEAPY